MNRVHCDRRIPALGCYAIDNTEVVAILQLTHRGFRNQDIGSVSLVFLLDVCGQVHRVAMHRIAQPARAAYDPRYDPTGIDTNAGRDGDTFQKPM